LELPLLGLKIRQQILDEVALAVEVSADSVLVEIVHVMEVRIGEVEVVEAKAVVGAAVVDEAAAVDEDVDT
jgi:hypothetical protein